MPDTAMGRTAAERARGPPRLRESAPIEPTITAISAAGTAVEAVSARAGRKDAFGPVSIFAKFPRPRLGGPRGLPRTEKACQTRDKSGPTKNRAMKAADTI